MDIRSDLDPHSPVDPPTDEELVRAFQEERGARSHPSFVALYRRYADKIYRKCLAYTGNETDAQDLTQEVFIKVFTGLPSFRFESSMATWLYRIARNHCMNFLRDRKTFVALENVEAALTGVRQSLPELNLDMTKALRRMDSATRVLFVLKYVEECTYQEIAQLTGLSVSAAKMRISRAKEDVLRAI